MISNDVSPTTGTLTRHWLNFIVLLLLLVNRCRLFKNRTFNALTHLRHWLRCLFEKEEHLSFVFYTDVNIQMLILSRSEKILTTHKRHRVQFIPPLI